MFYQIELPAVTTFRNLAGIIPAFMKKPDSAVREPRSGEGEQPRERRQGPCRDDFGLRNKLVACLDARNMNVCRGLQRPESRPKKRSFLVVAFDKIDAPAGPVAQQDCQHRAWKPAARAQIKPVQGIWIEGCELRAIENVAGPERINCGWSGQIDSRRPFPELALELLYLFECFT